MSALGVAVDEYLAVRRALGFKLDRAEKLLGQFVAYCETVGATTVRTEVAMAWAGLPVGGSSWWYAQRLGVVRAFALWLQAYNPHSEVPPAGCFGPATCPRAFPYPYTDAEVAALMEATSALRWPLERATYRSLIGLLAVTGMRVGEAIRLDRADVSWDQSRLSVRDSKFGKSRFVALHQSSLDALRSYALERDRLCPHPKAPSFLLSSAGTRLIYTNVSSLFRKLVAIAGLQPRSQRCRPRIHDYADLRVMPTSSRMSCSEAVGSLK
jgi:site-specific recombinase XerD